MRVNVLIGALLAGGTLRPLPSRITGTVTAKVKVNKLADPPTPAPPAPRSAPSRKRGKVYPGGSVPGGARRSAARDLEAG